MSTVSSSAETAHVPDSELARLLDQALSRADGLGLDLVAVRIAQAIDQLGGPRRAATEAGERD
jgi:hypothetical protein